MFGFFFFIFPQTELLKEIGISQLQEKMKQLQTGRIREGGWQQCFPNQSHETGILGIFCYAELLSKCILRFYI